jgi:hypothetical protein
MKEIHLLPGCAMPTPILAMANKLQCGENANAKPHIISTIIAVKTIFFRPSLKILLFTIYLPPSLPIT